MPSAARRQKQREAKAKRAAASGSIKTGPQAIVVDTLGGNDAHTTISDFQDFYIGDPKEEAQTQTDVQLDDTKLLELISRVELLEATLDSEMDLEDDQYAGNACDDINADPALTPEQMLKIEFLNSLSEQELLEMLAQDELEEMRYIDEMDREIEQKMMDKEHIEDENETKAHTKHMEFSFESMD